jgi:uncharacterized protein (DUF934 family)
MNTTTSHLAPSADAIKLIAANAYSQGEAARFDLQATALDDATQAPAPEWLAAPCIELALPKMADGRAFSAAVLLRRRWGYRGDIRAVGDVIVDQLPMLVRCGFTSAVLPQGVSVDSAQRQFSHFSRHYQAAPAA